MPEHGHWRRLRPAIVGNERTTEYRGESMKSKKLGVTHTPRRISASLRPVQQSGEAERPDDILEAGARLLKSRNSAEGNTPRTRPVCVS